MGTTKEIADIIVKTSYSDIPLQAIQIAKEAVLDRLDTTTADSDEPVGGTLTEYVKEFSHAVGYPKGNPSNPLTRKEILHKYKDRKPFSLSIREMELCAGVVSDLASIKDRGPLARVPTAGKR